MNNKKKWLCKSAVRQPVNIRRLPEGNLMEDPERFISRLKIRIFRLEICIFRLKIYIFRLEIKIFYGTGLVFSVVPQFLSGFRPFCSPFFRQTVADRLWTVLCRTWAESMKLF